MVRGMFNSFRRDTEDSINFFIENNHQYFKVEQGSDYHLKIFYSTDKYDFKAWTIDWKDYNPSIFECKLTNKLTKKMIGMMSIELSVQSLKFVNQLFSTCIASQNLNIANANTQTHDLIGYAKAGIKATIQSRAIRTKRVSDFASQSREWLYNSILFNSDLIVACMSKDHARYINLDFKFWLKKLPFYKQPLRLLSPTPIFKGLEELSGSENKYIFFDPQIFA